MSLRKAIVIFAVAVVISLVLVILRSGMFSSLPDENEGVQKLVMKKPATRPERPDLELFNRFSGQSIDSILAAVGSDVPEPVLEKSAAATLVSSLPRQPFPFPEGSEPVNEIALRQFAQSLEDGKLGKPSLVDLWRYNVASAALGTKPDSIPEAMKLKITPPVRTENFPAHLVERNGELDGPLLAANFDQNPELELISGGGIRMFSLDAEGALVERSEGLAGVEKGDALTAADYDNDGDLDLFIVRRAGKPNSLLQNDGTGTFVDVTVESGLLAFSDTADARWVDYDQDGRLDLLVGNHDHPFELYRQSEPGKFQPFSWELGLWFPKNVVGITSGDLNLDGYPDLILSISGHADQLLFSLPSSISNNWRFEEKGEGILPESLSAHYYALFDFDNDGDLDLLAGEEAEETEKEISTLLNRSYEMEDQDLTRLYLYQNNGEGEFSNVSQGCGLEDVMDVRGLHCVDIDNDGFEDVLVSTGDMAYNRAFWNRGGVKFREISQGARFSYLDSPVSIQSIDFDLDGSIDLFTTNGDQTAKWLEAEGSLNGWMVFSLEGSKPGTRIKITARDVDWILQEIHQTVDLIPQKSVGLGMVDKVEKVEFYPPQAIQPVKILEKIIPNQHLNINFSETNSQ